MIPRFFIAFILAGALAAPARGTAGPVPASDLDSIRVQLAVENVPLRQALERLVEQTQLHIVFSDALVKNITVSCRCREVTARQALNTLLAGTPLTFKVLPDGQVVIMKRKTNKKMTLKGFVKDAATGETLPYANVVRKGTPYGTASNARGYFVLSNIPAAPCTLVVHYIGYKSAVLPISEAQQQELITVYLQQQALLGSEITITAGTSQTVEVAENAGEVVLSPLRLGSMPTVGEVDVFRSLQLLPGISAAGDGSSALYVRGSTPNENLVLFDGITIYNVDHFFGFTSAFNADAVKNVRVFKGGFPAKFGGRTSSVVELTGKSGSLDRWQASVGANLLSANATLQVPLWGRGAWLISARRAYTDIVQSQLYKDIFAAISGQSTVRMMDMNTGAPPAPGSLEGTQLTQTVIPDFYYYDLTSKLSIMPTATDELSVSVYAGKDQLDQSQTFSDERPHPHPESNTTTRENVTEWGNSGVSGKWTRVWNSQLYTHLLAAYSLYSSDSNTGVQSSNTHPGMSNPTLRTDETNRVSDLSLRFDSEWMPTYAHSIGFGGELSRTNVRARFLANDTVETLNRDDLAELASLYLQDQWKIIPALQITPGLRATYYRPTGKVYFEPRLAFRLALSKSLALKGSWGEFYQFVNRITNATVLQGNRDFWLLADDRLRPGFARHAILGFSYETRGLLFNVEAYRKDLDGVSEFSQRFHMSPDEATTPLFYQGTGVARGIEFMLQKAAGRLNGWASYTLGRVEYTVPPLNNGQPYPADQDRRHEIKLVGNYGFGNWTLSSTWLYATGAPYTEPQQHSSMGHQGNERWWPAPSPDKNQQRLPDYHRLDVSLTHRFESRSATYDIGVSIYNLYDRQNIWKREFIPVSGRVIVRDNASLGLTPTVTVKISLK